jgi:hypothetical protein
MSETARDDPFGCRRDVSMLETAHDDPYGCHRAVSMSDAQPQWSRTRGPVIGEVSPQVFTPASSPPSPFEDCFNLQQPPCSGSGPVQVVRAFISATARGSVVVFVIDASVPPAPVDEVHVTSQMVVNVVMKW